MDLAHFHRHLSHRRSPEVANHGTRADVQAIVFHAARMCPRVRPGLLSARLRRPRSRPKQAASRRARSASLRERSSSTGVSMRMSGRDPRQSRTSCRRNPAKGARLRIRFRSRSRMTTPRCMSERGCRPRTRRSRRRSGAAMTSASPSTSSSRSTPISITAPRYGFGVTGVGRQARSLLRRRCRGL